MTPGPGFEPGPHWWEASAITTAPSLLPKTFNIHLPIHSTTYLKETSISLHGDHIHYPPWHGIATTVKYSTKLQEPVTKNVDY